MTFMRLWLYLIICVRSAIDIFFLVQTTWDYVTCDDTTGFSIKPCKPPCCRYI